MPGNTLGTRKWFGYTSDTGETYSFLTDNDLGVAAGATPDVSSPNFPRRFKPRVLFVQATIAGKIVSKSLIIPTADSSLFASSVSQSVTVDTTAFTSTGRRGESVSFPRNA